MKVMNSVGQHFIILKCIYIQSLQIERGHSMDKLSTDYINESTHNDKISPFNTIPKTSSKITKVKSQRTLKGPAAMKLNANDIEEQLMNQIQIATRIVQQFKDNMPQQITKHPKNSIQSLRIMEDVIRSKDQLIQEIQEQIKMLKNGSYNFHPQAKEKQKQEEHNIFRLANQIKLQREELKKYQSKFIQKHNDLKHKRQTLDHIQKKYKQKCKKEGLKQITFDEFKQLYRKRKKEEQMMGKHKRFQKNSFPSIKEIAKEKHFENNQSDSKKMKELISKKNVAQTALKTAKKKHQQQINELMGKLQFLKDQNADLEEKLYLKEQELKTAEGKFSQSRTSSDKRLLSKRFRTEQKF